MDKLIIALKQAMNNLSDEELKLAGKLTARPGTWMPGEPVERNATYLIHTSQFAGELINHGECGAHGDIVENSRNIFKQLASKGAKVYWQDHTKGIIDEQGRSVSTDLQSFLKSPLSLDRCYLGSDDRALFEVLPRQAVDGGHYGIGAAVVVKDGSEEASRLIALSKIGFDLQTKIRNEQPARVKAGLLLIALANHDQFMTTDLEILKRLISGKESAMAKANRYIEKVYLDSTTVDFTELRNQGVLLFYLKSQEKLPLIVEALKIPLIKSVAI